MTEGFPCPKCQTLNRPGAKFCTVCGLTLSETGRATVPIEGDDHTDIAAAQDESFGIVEKNTQNNIETHNHNTVPLEKTSDFDPRPDGAVFGDIFLAKQLIFTDTDQHRYDVTQLTEGNNRYRVCPNQDCCAIQPPAFDAAIYCTDCGTTLGTEEPSLDLVETSALLYENVAEIAKKVLSHGSVRAPIAAFEENLAGEMRYCVVIPEVTNLTPQPEAWEILDWSTELAFGLDYLHTNGLSFDGQLDKDRFAMDEDRAVWANFESCPVTPTVNEGEVQADVSALVAFIYHWLTGKSQYEHEPIFPDSLNALFEQGLSSSGFLTGFELGQAFQQTIEEMYTPRDVDYVSGRRTDVGMVRSLNEDSLLFVETSRNIQSASQPLGVYVVADGMGGHAAGEVASTTIVNSIAKNTYTELLSGEMESNTKIEFGEWLQDAVQAANLAVYEIRKSTGSDLGSTLVAALVERKNAYIAHVGDSRAYLINEKGIKQITTDHSLVERLVATGQITREEARFHHQRNVIYRTIGDKSVVDIDMNSLSLSSGDTLLLCSDGLSGMVWDEDIYRIVKQAPSPQAACDTLVDAAKVAGGDDNITVIIIKIISS